MQDFGYIERFSHLGFGMFVHFGLYSVIGKGEWYLTSNPNADINKYNALINKFKIKKNWAKDLFALRHEGAERLRRPSFCRGQRSD